MISKVFVKVICCFWFFESVVFFFLTGWLKLWGSFLINVNVFVNWVVWWIFLLLVCGLYKWILFVIFLEKRMFFCSIIFILWCRDMGFVIVRFILFISIWLCCGMYKCCNRWVSVFLFEFDGLVMLINCFGLILSDRLVSILGVFWW